MSTATSASPRVAIVTGAARGIGAATAARLAGEGHPVAVLDVDAGGCRAMAARIVASGGVALPVPADVTDAGEVAQAVARVSEQLGPPSIVVNNAGMVRDRPFGQMTDTDWRVVLDVNLRGPFLLCRAVLPHLLAVGWGRIVNLSSTSAMGNRDQANYSAAKAGVLGLTRALAVELGEHAITVNAVVPGYIVTDMTAGTAARLGVDFGEFQKMVASCTPVRRVGRPEDVAHAIAFLVSEDAGFISGSVIQVTGGIIR